MSSVVFICNLALSNIGKDNISDINEASTEAKVCKQFYEHTRDMLLQAHTWRWATRTQAMAAVANTKEGRWKHAYQRPSDCLKVHRVYDEMQRDYIPGGHDWIKAGGYDYAIEGRVIFTNINPAFLQYTRRVVDPVQFPPLFVDALAWHLATRLAMPLTRDPRIRADALQIAAQMTADAAISDANEVRQVSDYPTDWHEARDPAHVNPAVRSDV